jgi:hypothetical protein
MNCPLADRIAQANTQEYEGRQISFGYAEQFVKYYAGKEIFLDANLRVKKVQPIKPLSVKLILDLNKEEPI